MPADSPTTSTDWRNRVHPVPGMAAGQATIGSADKSVVEVLRRLAAGETDLDPGDVRACLAYAADVLAGAVAPIEEGVTLPAAAESADSPTLPPISAVSSSHHVPGYEIVGELGRGGMGVVYQARQIGLNRAVALKMILAGGHAGAKQRARFRAEAEVVARLQHPNIVQVYEVGEHDGLPYFSLEFVAGGTLAAQLDGKPWPPKQAAALVETLARAVHAAHQAGVVHRDLKPANVLLGPAGAPKIADFGIAKRLEADGPTRTGEVMGTPEYMAPEQAAGRKDIGPAADVWALGAVLYQLLTGRPPFRGPTSLDTILQVLEREPTPVRQLNRKAGRDLETVCWKCLQKDSRERYPSAAELAADLRRFQDSEPIRAKPASLWRRLSHRVKQIPDTASLGGVIVFLVLTAIALSRADTTIFGCTTLLALAATARVAIRPTIVGVVAGVVIVALFLCGTRLLVPADPLLGFPAWAYVLVPPVFGLAAGVCRREKGLLLFAYSIPVVLLTFTFVLQAGDHERLIQFLRLTVVAISVGLYFGVLGRIMAWLVDGPVAAAILGAIGGAFIAVMISTLALILWSSLHIASADLLGFLLAVPCYLFGTVLGAYLGTRRKRRRAISR